MGDPKKLRKKYSTPKHPWQSERLEKEKDILGTYALKNKKEIWKMQSVLKKYTNQAKKLANVKTEQAKKEKEQMIGKLFRLGLVKKNADVDDVLGLTMEEILERRLQTIVYKKNLANTTRQARQFIVHGHVFIGDRKMDVPSYLVKADEEGKVSFKEGSSLIGKFGKKEEEKKKKILKKEPLKETFVRKKVNAKEKKEEKKKKSKKVVKKKVVKKDDGKKKV